MPDLPKRGLSREHGQGVMWGGGSVSVTAGHSGAVEIGGLRGHVKVWWLRAFPFQLMRVLGSGTPPPL